MRRDTRATPTATMTPADARQAIRDQALQLEALVSGVVSVLCDRLDVIQFDDAASLARQAGYAHRVARQFGLVEDVGTDGADAAENEWLEPLEDAIGQLRLRLRAARTETPEDIDMLLEEIGILSHAERSRA